MLTQYRQRLQLLGSLSMISVLSACSLSPSEPVELGNSDQLEQAAQTSPSHIAASPQRFMLRGNVTLGHEVSAISPCGSKNQYWLELDANLAQKGTMMTPSPYASIYGEVIGEFVQPASDGFAADYPAVFKVSQLNLISAEIDGCKQARNNTVAAGNEPSWSVSIEGNTLHFNPLGGTPARFALSDRSLTPTTRTYTANGATLTLDAKICNDTMSDSLYGWTATFDRNGKTYKGCATLSADDPTQTWVGNYQGVTRLGSTSLSTTLTLNADHSAKTTYQEAGESPIEETGVWQQVNDREAHVMMTRHQGRFLVSERVFTRNGFSLHADSEVVNGRKYRLGKEGLSLSLMVGNHAEASNAPAKNGVNGSATRNPKVDAALKAYLGEALDKIDPVTYRWLTQDLNQDGQDELLVITDWCGSGGCTLLVFANNKGDWQFNSRITLVHLPFQMSNATSQGWHNLIMPVGGGGAKPATHVLKFNGQRYPGNPSIAPEVSKPDSADTYLFADGIYPAQQGVTLQ
ncbi:COG3650 family protein [Enterovibrio norvegicus]|uniref:COG3650 family protein n=1 Tax=Enterovibrio norvegicus TaxID=188144 RepID=UPI0009446B4B|nr:hypothetical protein [Enterovibrio norvegicus]